MNAFIQTLRNLGPTRLTIIGVVGVSLIAFFIYLMTRIGGPDMQLLYADLSQNETQRITQRLDAMGVQSRVGNDGVSIFVPGPEVGNARLKLAAEGLPSSGSIGYELFDKSQGLQTSSFVQNINQVRALEGELSRTIQTIDGVKGARVHLVLPQRELFSRERQEASGSVALRMMSAKRLGREQVVAIQNLVAFAVPGMKPHKVQVIDERGSLLAGSLDPDNPSLSLANHEEMRSAVEARMKLAIESMIDRALGPNMSRAEVSALLDFDRTEAQSEEYNPDQQVVRSTQTVNENSENRDSDLNPSVTVANNLPTAQANNQASGTSSLSRASRAEETTNFEISRTVRKVVKEAGGVKRLSVAVMVDGKYDFNEKGEKIIASYKPRTKQELDQLESLIKAAIGYDMRRDDEVKVSNLQFFDLDAQRSNQRQLFGLAREELFKLAEILVLGLVGALVLLLVVRPLIGRLFEAIPSTASPNAAAALLGAPGMSPALTGPRMPGMPGSPDIDVSDSIEEMIDLNRIEGRVKASSLRKIGEIVDKHPEDVVAIIRNWLYMEAN